MLTFKVLAALLSYPDDGLQDAMPEAIAILDQEDLIPAEQRRALAPFMRSIAAADIYDLQERYVVLFDRARSLSLHLYEHVHGESRDRGQAMVNLAELYKLHGLTLAPGELPDYLPAFLEFLSEVPMKAARGYLAESAHVLEALAQRLAERQSPYAAVFAALLALAGARPDREAVAAVLATLAPEKDTPEELDRQWEEEAVRFLAGGPHDQATPACRS